MISCPRPLSRQTSLPSGGRLGQGLQGIALLLLSFFLAVLPAARAAVPLNKINDSLYQTEHCIYIIDTTGQVAWPTYSSVYSATNIDSYITTLTTQFPGSYFSICIMANQLSPNAVPIYTHRLYKASGIYDFGTAGVPDYVRYNLGGNTVITGALAVFDHEIGHAWGVQILGQGGHWLSNSTVECQMSDVYSDDGYATVKQIYGDTTTGFRWKAVDNLARNDRAVFSDQQLYLMGLHPTLPTFYVLNTPVYNADNTMSYASLTTYDQASMVAAYGARNPDYRSSPKHFKLGFIYVARDLAEVTNVYQPIEQSISHFCNAEDVDTNNYRFQVPFLYETKFRASVEGRLSDLDGNAAPALTITDTYQTSSDGSAVIHFTASDPDGAAPPVSLVGTTATYSIQGSAIHLSGLTNGNNFFSAKAQDAGGKKAFGHFVVDVQIVPVAPSISGQPVNASITAGTTANFSVTGAGTPAPGFRWERSTNGGTSWTALTETATYTGTTTSTLSVVNATLAMNGDRFRCVATNSAGTVNSLGATLTVTAPVIAPSITSGPANSTVTAGAGASFSVTATGTAPLTYQWQKNGINIPGATSATYSLSTTSVADAGLYGVIVGNSAGSASSASATLSVNPAPTAPQISVAPQSVTATVGNALTFSVIATGTGPLAYQWKRGGAAIAGATGSTYSLAAVALADAGAYVVTVSNSVGSVTSATANLTVTSAPTAPAITAAPAGTTVVAGSALVLNVSATGSGPLGYQWRKDGADIAGATSSTYTVSSAQSIDAGDYTVRITNTVGSVTSSIATVSITQPIILPVVTSQPQSLSVTTGSDLSFSVTASGTAPLNYQWYFKGSALSGETHASLNIVSAQPSQAGNYSVVVSNAGGSASSNAATLQVTAAALAPSILQQPQAVSMSIGGSTTLSVNATGTAPLAYQWTHDGTPIPGANGATLSLSAVGAADSGDYVVTVSNFLGAATSQTCTVNVVSGSNAGHLINLSVRGGAGADAQTLIVGFIISGSSDLPVLVRGWGPTLAAAPFNVPGALVDPLMRSFKGTTQTGENDNWSGDAAFTSICAQVGAYAFSTGSKDAALYTRFSPGVANTVHILGNGSAHGVALAEVFDANPVYAPGSSRFINLSARGQVGTGADVLIGGFVIGGQAPVKVLIRAIGPTLTNFSVAGVLADPILELHAGPEILQTNDNWAAAANAAEVRALNQQMGLVLPDSSRDAAILATLNPGAYSCVLSGANNTTGVALLEIDEVP